MRNTLNSIAPGVIDFKRTLAVAWCSYSTVIQSRSWLPDGIGGVCWYAVDNPAQSPRIPIFCGSTKLPAAFEKCGQKEYYPNSVLWEFRRANKLATLSWQKTKKEFTDNVLEMETMAFEGLPELEAEYSKATPRKRARLLNAYTAAIHDNNPEIAGAIARGIPIVKIRHHKAPRGHKLGKAAEAVLDVRQIPEEVQVVGGHIQKHRHRGEKVQEGVAVFAALQNDGVALAHPVALAQQGQGAADHHGVSMCALAEMLQGMGVAVQGSDMAESPVTVGSLWAAMKIWVAMEVVVVLPWVPAMQRAF